MRFRDRVLDGDGGVHAVLVVEVDVIEAEAAQAGLAAGAHVLRPAADAPRAAGILPPQPELCGQLHLLPWQPLQSLDIAQVSMASACHDDTTSPPQAEEGGIGRGKEETLPRSISLLRGP